MLIRTTLPSFLICSFLFVAVTAKDTHDGYKNETATSAAESSPDTLESIFLTVDSNKVVSPFSVFSALIPLKFGADGQTKRELDAFLKEFEYQRSVEDPEGGDDISSLTVVFSSAALTLRPDYRQALTNANVTLQEGFNFRNYEAINDFVKNATNGLVQDLIGPTSLRKDTELVIINAVHFDMPWEYPFQATYKNIPFTLLDGTIQEIPMMYQKSSNYIAKVKDLDATILEIPYKSFRKVLRIYLPHKYNGLPSLLNSLQTYNTSSIIFKLSESEVTLPKFKIETQVRVTGGLDRLGLTSLTTSTANLNKIAKKALRVDEIISKCIIEVDESGTKAGSATGIFVVPLSGFIAEEVVANRPFYFEIRDTASPTVYFSGVFTTPDPPQSNSDTPVFVTRLNQPRPELPAKIPDELSPTPSVQAPKNAEEEDSDENGGEAPWWLHTGQPEYLMPKPDTTNSTPRFQQPEPLYPSGIRFPYPLKDPNTQLVIDSHLRNASINVV